MFAARPGWQPTVRRRRGGWFRRGTGRQWRPHTPHYAHRFGHDSRSLAVCVTQVSRHNMHISDSIIRICG